MGVLVEEIERPSLVHCTPSLAKSCWTRANAISAENCELIWYVTYCIGRSELFSGGVLFRDLRANGFGEGFFELLVDVDVFKDDELRALFALIEAAGASSDDNDGNVGGLGSSFDGGDEFAAAHKGHLHIGDDEIGADAVDDLKRVAAIGGRLHREAALFEEAADGMTDEHRIVDDQCDKGHFGAHRVRCIGDGSKSRIGPTSLEWARGLRWFMNCRRAGNLWRANCCGAVQGLDCSGGGVLSSIAMSLNSLDSKTSPHSRHSTYSESSSRLTICTRGCLH